MATNSHESEMRKLDGYVIGISVAESEDLVYYGYDREEVNRVTVRLSEALLSAGARLVFGHDWRPDGIMDAICRIAVRFQTLPKNRAPEPLIHNLIAWPDKPLMQSDLRKELEQRGVLKVDTVEIPDNSWMSANSSSANFSIARAIALTHLRRKLAKLTDARVCLGGKEKSAQGFFAGVVEEAYNAAMAQQPVFVGRFLGGAAAKLVAAIEHPNEKQAVLKVIEGEDGKTKRNYEEVANSSYANLVPERDLSMGFDAKKMQQASGLSPSDWEMLLNASDVESFSALTIRGLSQLPKPDSKPLVEPGEPDAVASAATVPIENVSAKPPTKRVSKKGTRRPPS